MMRRPDRNCRAATYAAMTYYAHKATDERHARGESRRYRRLRQLVEGWKARWHRTLDDHGGLWCECEHESHFDGTGHEYGGVAAGAVVEPTPFGPFPVCDACIGLHGFHETGEGAA